MKNPKKDFDRILLVSEYIAYMAALSAFIIFCGMDWAKHLVA